MPAQSAVDRGRCFLDAGTQFKVLAQQVAAAVSPEECSALAPLLHSLGRAQLLPEQQLIAWLQDGRISAQLAAAGYEHVEALLQQLAKVPAAIDAACAPHPTASSLTQAAEAVAEVLQEVGVGMSCFGAPGICNNAACVSVIGPTELSLVSGKQCQCAGCLQAYYCSRQCQRAAWKSQHKPVCKALAAAAAAGDAAAAAAQAAS